MTHPPDIILIFDIVIAHNGDEPLKDRIAVDAQCGAPHRSALIQVLVSLLSNLRPDTVWQDISRFTHADAPTVPYGRQQLHLQYYTIQRQWRRRATASHERLKPLNSVQT